MIRADMESEVLASNTPWYCVSCYFCMVRCPQEIHIPDIMYALKGMAIEANLYEERVAPDLADSFVGYVEHYGRSFEFGLATRHYLRHQPLHLLGKAQMGLGMLSKDRLELTPTKIDNIEQLQAILQQAKEIEEAVL
jgi:heterodisulfide reductase subunit C